MNKLFIGLLIVAAGTGAFFFFRNKNKTTASDITKEWIVGKWKNEPAKPLMDSARLSYQYEFDTTGRVIRTLNDSVKADTTHYSWTKKNELTWKDRITDSTEKVYSVIKLTQDSLQLRSPDSITFLFTRVK
jgi:hypothetical protein